MSHVAIFKDVRQVIGAVRSARICMGLNPAYDIICVEGNDIKALVVIDELMGHMALKRVG